MNSFQEAIPKPINFERAFTKNNNGLLPFEWTPNCWINIECLPKQKIFTRRITNSKHFITISKIDDQG
jgi:hypothetical protein